MGPALAAPGVTAKAKADKATAEAIATIEFVFMVVAPNTGCLNRADGEPGQWLRL